MTRTIPPPLRLPRPLPLVQSYEVNPAPPRVWRGLVPEDARRYLIAHWLRANASGDAMPPVFATGPVPSGIPVAVPDDGHRLVVAWLSEVAAHFGLPFAPATTQTAIVRYADGAGTDWHMDASHDGESWRTVAFTLLLNAAFEDGELETNPGGPVELAPGDLCGFTSRTWHRVAPVSSGERFALIAFGGFGS